ncbi:divergent polysaccharide deacetylase family protein [Rickettsiaceae bacterium]|nr:divergent polysaccharide deacetylase family protein [Rickettsiaceae bacterium]
MISDKHVLKRFLIVLNTLLALLLFAVILFWFLSARPIQINKATDLAQYRAYNIHELPSNINHEVKANYIGAKGTKEEVSKLLDKELTELVRNKAQTPKNNTISESVFDITINTTAQDQTKYGNNSKPKIAIIVTNLGINRKSTESAMTLPIECGFGFLPYTNNLKPLLHKAKAEGYEIYLYLPLASDNIPNKKKKYSLSSNLSNTENLSRLDAILNSQSNYDGVYSSYKEIFTSNTKSLDMLHEALDTRNLSLVFGKGTAKNTINSKKTNSNIINPDLIIDTKQDEEFITAQLENLVEIAKKNGTALGYANGFPITIETIKKWYKMLTKHGVELVPISKLQKNTVQEHG